MQQTITSSHCTHTTHTHISIMLFPLTHKSIFDILKEVPVHTHKHTQHIRRSDRLLANCIPKQRTWGPETPPSKEKKKKNLSHTKKLWNKTGHYRIKRRKKSPDFPPENVQQQQQQTSQWYDTGRTAVPDSSRPAALLAERRPMASNYFLGRMHLTEQQHTCNVLLHLACRLGSGNAVALSSRTVSPQS